MKNSYKTCIQHSPHDSHFLLTPSTSKDLKLTPSGYYPVLQVVTCTGKQYSCSIHYLPDVIPYSNLPCDTQCAHPLVNNVIISFLYDAHKIMAVLLGIGEGWVPYPARCSTIEDKRCRACNMSQLLSRVAVSWRQQLRVHGIRCCIHLLHEPSTLFYLINLNQMAIKTANHSSSRMLGSGCLARVLIGCQQLLTYVLQASHMYRALSGLTLRCGPGLVVHEHRCEASPLMSPIYLPAYNWSMKYGCLQGRRLCFAYRSCDRTALETFPSILRIWASASM